MKRAIVALLVVGGVAGCGGPRVEPDSGEPDGGASESCSDGTQNQDETDVDCGGACGATCTPGDGCGDGGDCTTGTCEGGTCQAMPSCDDGAQNGSETDVDCGGPLCMGCEAGEACTEDGDCASDVCTDEVCAAAACGDAIVNGDEDCDDGADGTPAESASCDVDCTAAECGDGALNPTAGEACDGDGAGTGGETGSCDADCTSAECGDGVVNAAASEECDGDGAGTGGETASCDADCTAASCGDGVPNATAGEECDDGNTVDDDACSNACVAGAPDLVIATSSTFDTDAGELDGAAVSGWDGAALQVNGFTLPAGVTLTVRGTRPLRVVAAGDASIAGIIDVAGRDGGDAPGCAMPGAAGGAAGPGGGAGGNGGGFGGVGLDGTDGAGSGRGGGGVSLPAEVLELAGGGGAGHVRRGNPGGYYPPAVGGTRGVPYAALVSLEGGSGGGGGSADDVAPVGADAGDTGGAGGGGGGGSVYVEARGAIRVSGTIDASGGDGGDGDACESGGGGGGSGGTIVLIAHSAAPNVAGANLLVTGGAAGPSLYAPGGAGSAGETYVGLPPTCSDGAVNQDESGVDCGGTLCGGCADGLACRAGADCASATCLGGECRPATCGDAAMSAGETDVDCGGSVCPGCLGGETCVSGADCRSGTCESDGTCAPPAFAESFESGSVFAPVWSTFGDASWIVSSVAPIAGARSAQSGVVGDDQRTSLAIDVTCLGAGSVTFTYRTDTEATYDQLYFGVDFVEVGAWGGMSGPATATFPLSAGDHNLLWVYQRDFTGGAGANTVWIDDVTITNCLP